MDFQQVRHRFWLCACCQPASGPIQLLTTATASFTHSQSSCQEPTACPALFQIQEILQKGKQCPSSGACQCVKHNSNKGSQHTDADSGGTDRRVATVTPAPARQVLTISKRIQEINPFMHKEYYHSGLKVVCSGVKAGGQNGRNEMNHWQIRETVCAQRCVSSRRARVRSGQHKQPDPRL